MDAHLSFGQWLKRRRRGLGLTQVALAGAVAYSPETLRKIEADLLRPSVQMAEKLAAVLEIEEQERRAFVCFARDEIGVDPLPLPAPSAPTARFRPASAPHNLPPQLTPFIGRTRELAALRALLTSGQTRQVTLTGAGGIGKSRLALEVAAGLREQFPQGLFFVALAQVTHPDQVAGAIARTLRLNGRGGESLVGRLRQHLRERHLLLLLDNFEHVVSAAPLLSDLLQAAPRLVVLVTSRELLRLYGEVEFPVPPLDLPQCRSGQTPGTVGSYDAVALFVQRARASRPDFQLTADNAAVIAELCHKTEGLPLAIELAAARSRILTPRSMLEQMPHRLTFLVGSTRDRPTRQQTLRATIEWSYQLLEEGERRLLHRLALFAGGATLSAIEEVCALAGEPPFATLDEVESLFAKSLLRRHESDEGEPRFVMLATIREFALERLVASGEGQTLRDRHLAYFLTLAEAAEPEIWGPQQAEWLNLLAREYDNLRAALEWSLTPGREVLGLRLAGALWWFWLWRGPMDDGPTFLAALLAATTGDPPTTVRTRALTTAANLAVRQRALSRAVGFADEALAACRKIHDQTGLVHALTARGEAAEAGGEDDDAERCYNEALRVARAIDDHRATALVLNSLGNRALNRGENARAAHHYQEALELFRRLGNQWCVSFQLRGIGISAMALEDYARAADTLDEALALDRAVGYATGICVDLALLGQVARRAGRLAAAAALAAESLAVAWELDSSYLVASCLSELGGVASAQRHADRAAVLLGAADAILETAGVRLDAEDQLFHNQSVAAARARLPAAAFAAAWRAGRAMTLGEAVEYALNGSERPTEPAIPPS